MTIKARFFVTLFMVALICIASVSAYAGEENILTYEESAWSGNIYYVASLSGMYGKMTGYQDITLHITAVDDYELYVNGIQYDNANDNDVRTVDTYNVNLGGEDTMHIGVKVVNYGLGKGNGLIMDIVAGSDTLGTSLQVRDSQIIGEERVTIPVAWWTFDETGRQELFPDSDWFVFTDSLFQDSEKRQHLTRSMAGAMYTSLNYTFLPQAEVITGYQRHNIDTGISSHGAIQLRHIDGENIALNKPTEIIELTDGILESTVQISSPVGKTRFVDLGSIQRVNKVTLTTGGNDPDRYDETSVAGYTVEVSLDNYGWEEVGSISGIGAPDGDGIINEGGYDYYSVEFPGEWARYVRFNITHARLTDPVVGEMLVFGRGFASDGYYESPWIDMGSPTAEKNFESVSWQGDMPSGTSITVQTMTKLGVDGTPSEWRAPTSSMSFMFDSPEPATHVRYRVNLSSQDIIKTPVFTDISFNFSLTDQPVTFAEGHITPETAQIGEQTSFVYTLAYTLAEGQNLNNVDIMVPSISTLSHVYSSELADNVALTSISTIDTLSVTFDEPIINSSGTTADTLYFYFDATILGSTHTFDTYLFNTSMNDGAGGVKVTENGAGSITVSADIVAVKEHNLPTAFDTPIAYPNPFNPSTSIAITVQENCIMRGDIYSITGQKVCALFNDTVSPGKHTFVWDSCDNSGMPVSSGIYLFRAVTGNHAKSIPVTLIR